MAQGAYPADTRILEQYFREHNSWLIGWIKSRARSANNAEDVASEVFVRLLTMGNLETIREPRAMMATIARRLIIELFRRSELQRAYQQELAALPEACAVSPEHQLIVIEAIRAIDRALATLSNRARTAFLLSQIDGLKYADIAAEVGVSVSMAQRYIAQGLVQFYKYHPDHS